MQANEALEAAKAEGRDRLASILDAVDIVRKEEARREKLRDRRWDVWVTIIGGLVFYALSFWLGLKYGATP